MTHSPAHVTAYLLELLELGSIGGATWPVRVGKEPDTPDNCLTTYNTAGRDQGRLMRNGARKEMFGVMIRVRSSNEPDGAAKAYAIAEAIDLVYQRYVTVDGTQYFVHSASRPSSVLANGEELGISKRRVFTVNILLNVRQVT